MSEDRNQAQVDNAYTAPAEGDVPFQFSSRLQPPPQPEKSKKQRSGTGAVIVAAILLVAAAAAAAVLLLRYSLTIRHGENGISVRISRRSITDPILSLAGVDDVPDRNDSDPGANAPHYEWDGAKLNVNAASPGAPLDYGQIYRSCAPSIAVLEAHFGDGGSRTGTAIVITEDGALLASTHIISGADRLNVKIGGTDYTAYIIGLDYASDLAVLKVDAHGLTAAQFCGSDSAAAGDPVAVVGNPVGGVVNITDGILSAVNRGYSYRGYQMDVFQFTGLLSDIASGSALVNMAGQVIGIVNPDLGSGSGISFAISMRSANGVINELLQNGFVAGRPSSGLTVSEMPAAYAAYYGYPSSLYISAVEELSPAYEAGLRRGDVILEAGGAEVETISDLYTVINGMSAGDMLTLKVFRDGEIGTISFELMEATNPRK